jgi:hypothetical protein
LIILAIPLIVFGADGSNIAMNATIQSTATRSFSRTNLDIVLTAGFVITAGTARIVSVARVLSGNRIVFGTSNL